MHRFIKSFYAFVKNDYKSLKYLPIFAYASFLIIIIYSFNIYSYIKLLDKGSFRLFLSYFIIYSISYYPIVFWIKIVDKQLKIGALFWLKTTIVIFILSLSPTIDLYAIIGHLYSSDYGYLIRKSAYNLKAIIITTLIIALSWNAVWKNTGNFMWISFKKNYYELLVPISLVILIIVVIAINLSGFNNSYPSFKIHYIDNASICSSYIQMIIFQIAYSLDFLSVELLFRGALVLGLYKLMGTNAILPMITLYAVLHMGKPLGETISSFFGGYVLAYITLYYNSIVPAFLIHVILALGMEWAAHLCF